MSRERGREVRVGEGVVTKEERLEGCEASETRNTGDLSKLEKTKKHTVPWSLQKKQNSADTLILVQ